MILGSKTYPKVIWNQFYEYINHNIGFIKCRSYVQSVVDDNNYSVLDPIKMPVPTLKRINTVGIKYIEGELKEEHYEIIIEKILKVKENEV